jgi:ribosome recycling factor
MLWNVEIDAYRNRNARNDGIKKLLKELCMQGLTADCVRKKNKKIKTVYSKELNKIMKSKKSGAGANDLYKPKLTAYYDV